MCRSFPLRDAGALECVRGRVGRSCLLAGGSQVGGAKMALAEKKKRKRKGRKKGKYKGEKRWCLLASARQRESMEDGARQLERKDGTCRKGKKGGRKPDGTWQL